MALVSGLTGPQHCKMSMGCTLSQVDVPEDAADQLRVVLKLLTEHAVSDKNGATATHQVLNGYNVCGSIGGQKKGPTLFAINDEGAVEDLHKFIAQMYQQGYPLNLGERLTEKFTLFQDIVVRGNRTNTLNPEDLVGPESKLLEIIGRTMVELFPTVESFDLFVLAGSGQSEVSGAMETSIRLVWKDVVVDQKRALSILDLLVSKIQNSDCPEVRLLEQKAKGYSAANEWRACFRDFAYKSDQPVRMVFNDSVSQAAPLFRPEKRPLDLFCIYELTHNQGILDEIKVFSRGMEVSSEDYQTLLKCTSIRQIGWVLIACLCIRLSIAPG
ncbi:unnamed protein product [Durusdinium trenchii]|uniref:Uncharacterized protein n=1 Tax=Durusdinium trenchii TaxID=1381693 RepID=A0ABP0L2A5_9DINO